MNTPADPPPFSRDLSGDLLALTSDQISEPCQSVAARCRCQRPTGHSGTHECRCDGAWNGELGQDDFEPVRFPSTVMAEDWY